MNTPIEKLNTIIAFDIDTSSVGVSVIGYDLNTATPVHEYFSQRESIQTRISFDDFFVHTLKVFESLAHKALKYSPGTISNIYVSLGNPWLSSQKKIISYEKTKDFKVNQELLNKLIETEKKQTLAKNLDYHSFKGLEVIERKVLEVYLNGYRTLDPMGKKVTNIKLHMLISVMSTSSKQAFTHVIERVFNQEPIFISNTFVLHQAVKKFIPNEDNLIIMDIGGLNTQISVIYNDKLTEIASFPVGCSQIQQELAKRAKITELKAQSLLEMYPHESIHPEYREDLTQDMDAAYQRWMKAWYELCDKLSAKRLLPGTICMIAPRAYASWFQFQILKTDEIIQHLHLNRRPQLIDLPRFLELSLQENKAVDISDYELMPLVDVIGYLQNNQSSYE